MWIWTKLAEKKIPERKAGTKVDDGYLSNGRPIVAWIEKGYVERAN